MISDQRFIAIPEAAIKGEMNVRVYESGQHVTAFRVNDGRAVRDTNGCARANGADARSPYHYNRVRDRLPAISINDRATDDGQRSGLRAGRARRNETDGQREPKPSRRFSSGH
jgi:hypothetical protein